MTVGIVVVSHSRALAEAAVGLAAEMLHGRAAPIEVAAGLDDGGFGTDAVAIHDAVGRADHGDGVVVLMDMGSAVLSAELALELLDDDERGRVLLCPGPLVEGLIVAAVAADSGATAREVADEAMAALGAKESHLSPAEPTGQADEPAQDTGNEATAVFTVTMPHGLHARPSALLVQAVRRLDADVRLRNRTAGTGFVPAGSLSKVATLGALQGHEVEVRAVGRQADEAVKVLLDLARDGFGEATSAPPPPPPAAPASGPARPVPASPGIGIGRAQPLRDVAVDPPDDDAADAATAGERTQRLQQALREARQDVQVTRDRTAAEIGEAEAAIFDAHLLLLDDPDLIDAARRRIEEGAGAARAWADSLEPVAAELTASPDAYMQARAVDVRDVRNRVLRRLGGVPSAGGGIDGVLVAPDLTPAEAAALDPTLTAAVVLAHGSPTAHSTILLRARGIPAVVGVGALADEAKPGTVIAVDGSTGQVVLDPDESVLAEFRDRATDVRRRSAAALARADEPAVTADGTTVLVGANLGSADDARAATGADLAGLVRTEFCFLGRSAAPTVDEQEAAYRGIAEAMSGRRTTLRTLDVGGDKPLDYLPMRREANPFLGVRGIRLALAREDLLRAQLEAFVRVGHDHPVDVMFPMITTVDELLAARGVLDDAVRAVGRGEPAGLRVGIMVEVPATALKAAAFAPHVDFLSIGTNDLTQYALAAERGNEELVALADPLDPGVLALIAAAGATASDDFLVAVCGELASDEQAVPVLLGLGVRELSVAPAAVARVKEAVRRVDIPAARGRAAASLAAPDAATVRRLLSD
jgi:multiphosphoryl transfer protein